jgi:hypothetical protein
LLLAVSANICAKIRGWNTDGQNPLMFSSNSLNNRSSISQSLHQENPAIYLADNSAAHSSQKQKKFPD